MRKFSAFLNDESRDYFQVCDIEHDIAQAIGANTCAAILSRETMAKQAARHKDILAKDYAYLVWALDDGLAIKDDNRPQNAIICFQHPHIEYIRYRIYLKCTKSRDEIFIDSFHRTKMGQTRSMLKRGPIIRTHR